MTLVGGGAPPGLDLTAFLWQESSGIGVATVVPDERGEFAVGFDIPWLLGMVATLRPGLHRLSLQPTEGGPGFDAHTHVRIPPFAPPGTLTWQTEQSQKTYGIAVFNTGFRVQGRQVTWYAAVRNDNEAMAAIDAIAGLVMIHHGEDMVEVIAPFEFEDGRGHTMSPGDTVNVEFVFNRTFDVADDSRLPGARMVRLRLVARVGGYAPVFLNLHTIFPLEVWVQQDVEATDVSSA